MAPAPIAKKITDENGEYENPPIQAPKIAGEPAISPKPTSFVINDFLIEICL